jgi:hypothetical protein
VDVMLIPKKEILRDFFFCYSSEADLSALERSVRSGGIRHPISVLDGDGGYRILAGFRRFRAAESAGLGELPCRLLSPKIAVERHFEEALLEQLSQRELHPVEKARVLGILKRLSVPADEVVSRFYPLLGLAPKTALADEVSSLLSFHPSFLSYLEGQPVSLKQALAFRPFSPDDQAALADLGTTLQIRIVELSEIAGWVRDLIKVRGVPAADLIRRLGIRERIDSPDLNRNERLAAVKEILKRERFPILESVNEKIRSLRLELSVPECIRLTWDPSLEEPGFRMDVRIRSAKDLDAVAAFFSSAGNGRRMKEMLALV